MYEYLSFMNHYFRRIWAFLVLLNFRNYKKFCTYKIRRLKCYSLLNQFCQSHHEFSLNLKINNFNKNFMPKRWSILSVHRLQMAFVPFLYMYIFLHNAWPVTKQNCWFLEFLWNLKYYAMIRVEYRSRHIGKVQRILYSGAVFDLSELVLSTYHMSYGIGKFPDCKLFHIVFCIYTKHLEDNIFDKRQRSHV